MRRAREGEPEAGRELRIDWIRCEGYGLCGDLAPDLIALDDWRYPIIDPSKVPDSRLSDAQRVVDCCPTKALALIEPGVARRAGRRHG